MTTPNITARLRNHIEIMENSFNIKRNQLGRKRARSYYINYQRHETKPVRSSSVYLYKLPSVSGKEHSFSLSFDFFENKSKYGYESFKKKNINEQTVTFGYCLDAKAKNKKIFKSQPFYLEEAKEILKELNSKAEKIANGKHLNTLQFIKMIEELVFDYDFKNQDHLIQQGMKDIDKPKQRLQKLLKAEECAKKELDTAQLNFSKEREECEEYKRVKELREELSKAEKLFTEKSKKLKEEHKVKEIETKYLKCKNNYTEAKNDFDSLIDKTITKLKIAGRYLSELKL